MGTHNVETQVSVTLKIKDIKTAVMLILAN